MLLDVITAIVLLAAGLTLVWVARATADGRLGRNRYAGIRTRTTYTSDAAWRTAHRAARPLIEAAGWVLVVAGPATLLVHDDAAELAVTLGAAGAVLVLVIAGAVVGTHAVKASTGSR